MATTQKITINVTTDVLRNARLITGAGITPTVIAGLHELERGAKRSALRKLRGKVVIALDLERTRK